MEIAEFLLARIAEDETVARSVQEVEPKSGSDVFTSLGAPTGTVEMSPRRVLAECEAKRRIVELMRSSYNESDVEFWALHDALQLLAAPYAHHPDYNPEWKVAVLDQAGL